MPPQNVNSDLFKFGVICLFGTGRRSLNMPCDTAMLNSLLPHTRAVLSVSQGACRMCDVCVCAMCSCSAVTTVGSWLGTLIDDVGSPSPSHVWQQKATVAGPHCSPLGECPRGGGGAAEGRQPQSARSGSTLSTDDSSRRDCRHALADSCCSVTLQISLEHTVCRCCSRC